ncbi:glycosyltransferase family 4 protein [Geodermatophilus sp. SYSU D00758]
MRGDRPQDGDLSGRRVLMVTSHPLDARDGADKELAYTIASGMPEVDFTWFGRMGARSREPLSTGRRLPLLSATGMPGRLERAQAAGLALLLDRRVDLVHAVVTIGPHFARFVRLRERLRAAAGGRPAVHTVPAVADVTGLRGTPALGTTVVLSRSTQQTLVDAGFPDVRLIPPGIDLSRWPVRPRAHGPGEAPVVGFAGHYDPEGGLWESVVALGDLVRRGRDVRAVFLMRPRPGQDEARQAAELVRRCREVGLVDVRVHGRTRDMPGMLAGIDLLLLPARDLGGKADVPLTVLEAMAAGRPVVVTDLPQMQALGEQATRVPVGDVPALAGAVARLLDEPARWEALAASGRALVQRGFSSDLMLAGYRELYAELLDGPKGEVAA